MSTAAGQWRSVLAAKGQLGHWWCDNVVQKGDVAVCSSVDRRSVSTVNMSGSAFSNDNLYAMTGI
jgi:hypothetical protein